MSTEEAREKETRTEETTAEDNMKDTEKETMDDGAAAGAAAEEAAGENPDGEEEEPSIIIEEPKTDTDTDSEQEPAESETGGEPEEAPDSESVITGEGSVTVSETSAPNESADDSETKESMDSAADESGDKPKKKKEKSGKGTGSGAKAAIVILAILVAGLVVLGVLGVRRHQSTVAWYQGELSAAQQQVKDKEAEIDDLDSQVSSLTSKNDTLQADIDKKTQEITDLTDELNTTKDALAQAESQNKLYKTTIDSVKENLKMIEASLDALDSGEATEADGETDAEISTDESSADSSSDSSDSGIASASKLPFAGGYISEADANVVMTISDGNGENAVSIEITDTTGKTTTVWSMDGTFNPDRNRIRYTDGKKTTKKGSGSRDVVYEDGRGSLTIESDGSIVWKSKNDGDEKEVIFQPDDADQENS